MMLPLLQGAYLDRCLIFRRFLLSLLILFFFHLALIAAAESASLSFSRRRRRKGVDDPDLRRLLAAGALDSYFIGVGCWEGGKP